MTTKVIATIGKPPIHNLFSREIRPIRDWEEWLERWQSAVTIEEMLGLLHVGLTISHGSRRPTLLNHDHVIFYLHLADGWVSPARLRSREDNDTKYQFGFYRDGNPMRIDQCGMRQIVATKAFDMLCINFFRAQPESKPFHDCFIDNWERTIVTKKLFPEITYFFSVNEEGCRNIRLDNGLNEMSHNEKHVTVFLLNLAEFIWRWKETPDPSYGCNTEFRKNNNIEMRALLDSAKPWMIEVLNLIGKLGVLEKWSHQLDQMCLDKIREIAMRNRFGRFSGHVREDRLVANIDEACYLGSPAAWFLKRHELVAKEHARLTAIREAEQAREQATQTIQELSRK